MSTRSAISLLSLVVAVSLIGAPLTMHDWGEKSHITASQVEDMSEVDEETPVYQFESLSQDAQIFVEKAIHQGEITIYGAEDKPSDFDFVGVLTPGSGRYIIVYEGTEYQVLTTGGSAAGIDPLERTALQLPFVGYGLFLLYISRQIKRSGLPIKQPIGFVSIGSGFHLLGPEFDFWIFTPVEYSLIGVLGFLAISWWSIRDAL